MTGHARTHNTTADFTGRPYQSTTVITTWGGFGLRQTLRAFNETLFIDQGLTPGNIDIHPQYSFKKTALSQVHHFRLDLYGLYGWLKSQKDLNFV